MKLFATAMLLSGLTLCVAAPARPPPEQLEALPPPDLPGATDFTPAPDAEITIRDRDGTRIEEHRINGRLVRVRITPSVGPSYYLVDQDGDGFLEAYAGELSSGYVIPQWILFSW